MAKKLQTTRMRKRNKGKNRDQTGLGEARKTLEGASTVAGDLGLTGDLPTLDTGRLEGNLGMSQDLQDLVTTMRGGLAGLSAAENVALMEQARKDIDRQYQGTVRDITNANATTGAGAKSGRSFAQRSLADKNRMMAQSDLEQGLLTKNIDIQDSRRKALGDLLANEGDRSLLAQGQLLDAQKTNLGQANATKAGNLTAITGVADLAQNSLANKRAFRLAKRGMRRSGSSSSSSGNQSSLYNAVSGAANSLYPGISEQV